MTYGELDTPALLIDNRVMMENIAAMQQYADRQHVKLRPHTKTHKTPGLAKLQEKMGASGITVAKVGEAEVMAAHGLTNIFIANQIVGEIKLKRIRKLAESIYISFGIDCVEHVHQIEDIFRGAEKKAEVLIEIEVGEARSGVIEESDFRQILQAIQTCDSVHLKGIFSHDGHTYQAESKAHCQALYEEAVDRTLHFAQIAEEEGIMLEVVSIGSTPPFLFQFDIPKGVTEIRPGTYMLMDASQSNVIGTFSHCAVTVLTTVISKPTKTRVITDVGAKGLTAQTRTKGLTKTKGLGKVKEYNDVFVSSVFDEHAIIYHEGFRQSVQIGEKVQIIPNHICPVVNLHEKAYLIQDGEVIEELVIACKGKLQ
ncbi:alanine racemase [Bacillus pumilus]|uniref:Alanine racemase n=1 Tax=Bacillus pumilus TaxID=1408 RepID=A0A2A5IXI9_BACPU|nr:D-TA family PLP-dependent enzyme [Bacillus pumilus]PCK22045.1 alanine racemase [Bacillus pumilus]